MGGARNNPTGFGHALAFIAGISFVGVWVVSAGVVRAATPSSGITISPAAITLSLPKIGESKPTAITITNAYSAPIALNFSFEASDIAGDPLPPSLITFTTHDVTVAPGEHLAQTITIDDTRNLAPGSHVGNIVITQAHTDDSNVAIAPQLRLPITIIKEDGAVATVVATNLHGPTAVSLVQPRAAEITIQNTGNVTAIPRGYITVQNSFGTVVGQGTINTASTALGPHANALFSVPLTTLARSNAPGNYTLTAHYGLGGDAGQQQLATSFWFATWWQVGGLTMVVAAMWAVLRFLRLHPLQLHKDRTKPLNKRPLLIGRDIQ